MTEENTAPESSVGDTVPQESNEGTSDNYSEISDADLDKLLVGDEEEPADDSVDNPSAPTEVETSKTAENTETSEEEPSKEDESSTQTNTKSAVAKMTPEELQKAYDKQQQQLQQTNEFVQRRNTELGELRQKLRQAQAQLQEGLDEKFQESPQEALKDYQALQAIGENLKGIEQEEHTLNSTLERQQVVARHLKPGDVDIEDMLQALRDDGIQEQYVTQFKQNPWQMAQAETIIQLGKRAKAERALRSLLPVMQKLLEENKSLKQKPQKAINNLVNAIQSESPSIGATHDNDSGRDLSSIDTSEWTDAELNSFVGR